MAMTQTTTFPSGHQSRRASIAPPADPTEPQIKRKMFNCIVDDTALIAGVKKSLKKWVNVGNICIFVPLHSKTGPPCLDSLYVAMV
jgi:hypothetical protein